VEQGASRSPEKVIGVLEQTRPDVLVLDNHGRTAILERARVLRLLSDDARCAALRGRIEACGFRNGVPVALEQLALLSGAARAAG
jgi:hypothetical protein